MNYLFAICFIKLAMGCPLGEHITTFEQTTNVNPITKITSIRTNYPTTTFNSTTLFNTTTKSAIKVLVNTIMTTTTTTTTLSDREKLFNDIFVYGVIAVGVLILCCGMCLVKKCLC